MTYNLTAVENATSVGDFIIEMNVVSNQWIFSAILLVMYLVVLITIKQGGFDFGVAFLSSSLSVLFIGAFILYFGGIGWTVYGIILGLSMISLFVFALGGK